MELYQDKEWLDDRLKEGFSIKKIAKEANCSRTTIFHYMDKFGLKKLFNREQWLKNQVEEGRTPEKIAEKANCGESTISQKLQKIYPLKERKPYQKEKWLREHYCQTGKSLNQLEDELDLSYGALAYWIRQHNLTNCKEGHQGILHRKKKKKPYQREGWLVKKISEERTTKEELAEENGVARSTINTYLNKYDLKPLYNRYIKKRKLTCFNCGQSFLASKRYAKENKYYFCSYSCYKESRNEVNKREGNVKNKQTTCDFCGAKIRIAQDLFYKREHHFCDLQCFRQYQKEFGNCRYATFSEKKWKTIRKEVLRRDNFSCQKCGVSKDDLTGTKSFLEVHHKIPKQYFRSSRRAHRMSNLVTLCSKCHKEVENRLRKSPMLEFAGLPNSKAISKDHDIPKYRKKEWLREKFLKENKTAQEISDIVGCARGTIYSYIQKFGLREEKEGKKKWQDKKWLTRQLEQTKTYTQVAQKADCGSDTISKWVDKFSLKPKELRQKWIARQISENKKTVKDLAKHFDVTQETIFSWLGKNPYLKPKEIPVKDTEIVIRKPFIKKSIPPYMKFISD